MTFYNQLPLKICRGLYPKHHYYTDCRNCFQIIICSAIIMCLSCSVISSSESVKLLDPYEKNKILYVFQNEYLNKILSGTNQFLVVIFSNDLCAACKRYAPIYKETAINLSSNEIRFITMDTVSDPKARDQYSIKGIPTTIVFKNGQELGRILGAVSNEKLNDKLKTIINMR